MSVELSVYATGWGFDLYVWVHMHSQWNMPMFCLKKNHFSALGGPKVAIFGRDDFDPLYFDVSNFLVTPDPPYMSKNEKCAIFSTF